MHIQKTYENITKPIFLQLEGQERCYLQSQINGLHWPVLALWVTQFAFFSESLRQKRNITTCKYLTHLLPFTVAKGPERISPSTRHAKDSWPSRNSFSVGLPAQKSWPMTEMVTVYFSTTPERQSWKRGVSLTVGACLGGHFPLSEHVKSLGVAPWLSNDNLPMCSKGTASGPK